MNMKEMSLISLCAKPLWDDESATAAWVCAGSRDPFRACEYVYEAWRGGLQAPGPWPDAVIFCTKLEMGFKAVRQRDCLKG